MRVARAPVRKRADEAASNSAPGVPTGDLTKRRGDRLDWFLEEFGFSLGPVCPLNTHTIVVSETPPEPTRTSDNPASDLYSDYSTHFSLLRLGLPRGRV